jgi:hypothetical protein
MDSALINIYRVFWSDLLMIYDTASIYLERNISNRSFSDFAEGLRVLMREENEMQLVPIDEDVVLSEGYIIN